MTYNSVFIDSDILLDLILNREPFSIYAEQLFALPQAKKIRLSTSTVIIMNIYYFAAKRNGKKTAEKVLTDLLTEVNLLSVEQGDIEFSLKSGFADFEDGVQYSTARKNKCDVILTRNLSDYKKSTIPVMTAEQFIKSIF